MTNNELVAKAAVVQRKMLEAHVRHELALKAFEIACLRHNWVEAEKEQQLALETHAEWMDAFQAIHRLAQ